MAAIRRLPSGKWSAEVRLPNGRRTTTTDTSKTFVRQWAQDLESRIRRGEWTDPRAPAAGPALTLGAWRAQWIATRHREMNTAAREDSTWRLRVRQFQNRRLDQITRLDIQAWDAAMSRDGTTPHSHAQALDHLRQLLNAAVVHNLIPADPGKGIKRPTPPKHVDRILTRDEWARLDAATGYDPMIRAMLWCGLRWQEAAGLHGDVVDLDRAQLRIVRVRLKNGVIKPRPKSAAGYRSVPIPPVALETLAEVWREGELFTGPRGRVLQYDNWRRRFSRMVRAAGLADPQPTGHDLRHSYATWLADAGVPIHDIGSLLGHSDTKSTSRYIHSGISRDQAALDALAGNQTGTPPPAARRPSKPLRPRRPRKK